MMSVLLPWLISGYPADCLPWKQNRECTQPARRSQDELAAPPRCMVARSQRLPTWEQKGLANSGRLRRDLPGVTWGCCQASITAQTFHPPQSASFPLPPFHRDWPPRSLPPDCCFLGNPACGNHFFPSLCGPPQIPFSSKEEASHTFILFVKQRIRFKYEWQCISLWRRQLEFSLQTFYKLREAFIGHSNIL